MKRLPIQVAILLVALAANSSAPLGAQPAAVLTWCTNPLYPPYDWAIDPTAYDGAGVELLSEIIPPGPTLRPLVVPWERAQMMAAEGRVDLLMCIRITPERSRYLDFSSVPVFRNPIVVWARKDRPFSYSSWSDLKGHLGGISRGDYFGGGFDEYLRSQLAYEEAASMKENFEKLALGRIEWFVSGYYLGLSWLRTHAEGKDIDALEPPISNEGIYLGIAKTSPWRSLLTEISARLRRLSDRGVPDALLRSYLEKYVAAPDRRYVP